MSDFVFPSRSQIGPRQLVGSILVVLVLSLTGCGVLGGGGDDEGEDGKYPEPPGRPNAAMMESPSAGALEVMALSTGETEGGFDFHLTIEC